MDLLQAAVKPQIDMLLKAASSSSSSTSTSYEVDPARFSWQLLLLLFEARKKPALFRLPDNADIEGNQARLLQLATSIFDSICREIDRYRETATFKIVSLFYIYLVVGFRCN